MTDSTIDPHRFQYGIGKDTIPSIDQPRYVTIDDPRLATRGVTRDTPVLGVTIAGEARAHPVWVMDMHEIVNDEFGTSGYTMDHVFVLYDRASDSVWYPSDTALEAVGGTRKGSAIPFIDKPGPVVLDDWLAEHPDSTILLPDERDYRMANRPYLGLRLEDGSNGPAISAVSEGSPAEAAGLRDGDILRSIGGHEIHERCDIRDVMAELTAGEAVDVVVQRGRKRKTLRITPRARD